jgi:hypothetical protein
MGDARGLSGEYREVMGGVEVERAAYPVPLVLAPAVV